MDDSIMRWFLYFDEDSVNSYLAQIERGLITQNRNEGEESETSSTNKYLSDSITGDLSAKVVGIGASINENIELAHSETEVASKLVKEVQERILHDYAFDKMYDYFVRNNLIVDKPNNIGDIVLINEMPTFLDFEFFQKLFSDEGVVKYAEEQNKAKMLETISLLKTSVSNCSRLPPDQKTKVSEWKSQIKQLEAQVKDIDVSRKDTEKMITVFRNTIPYNRSLMTANYLIPCNDKKFRDDPNIVAFKYGGNISILGYITNVISSNTNDGVTSNNVFAGFYSTLNKTMLSLFNDKERIFILHPIALFY